MSIPARLEHRHRDTTRRPATRRQATLASRVIARTCRVPRDRHQVVERNTQNKCLHPAKRGRTLQFFLGLNLDTVVADGRQP